MHHQWVRPPHLLARLAACVQAPMSCQVVDPLTEDPKVPRNLPGYVAEIFEHSSPGQLELHGLLGARQSSTSMWSGKRKQ